MEAIAIAIAMANGKAASTLPFTTTPPSQLHPPPSLATLPRYRKLPGKYSSAVVAASTEQEGVGRAATAQGLFSALQGSEQEGPVAGWRRSKVAVVGVGSVGMACAQALLAQGAVEELALVDTKEGKARGEMMDLQHGAAFLPAVRVSSGTDYAVTAGSDVCIVTAGVRQREGEARTELAGRNVTLLRSIIPGLLHHTPHTLLLIVSNPVDILAYAAWKLSGLPACRVVGTGTSLDSSRFRFLIADRLHANPHNVHAYILGEHGDSSVPLWSSVSVGGVRVLDLLDRKGSPPLCDEHALREIHRAVMDSAYEVIRLKGYTSWAIGHCVASLVTSLLRDERRIYPVCVMAKGFHGIEKDVYLSLPAQLGRGGALSVVNTPLSEEERAQLLKSANTLWDFQSKLHI